MRHNDLQGVHTTHVTQAPARPRGAPAVAWLAGLALVALAGAGAYSNQMQLAGLMTELAGKSLEQAAALLDRTLEQQRANLLAESQILSEDTRVRTTVMTPQFNEATVRDVLEDLRRTSGAAVMAVLDVRGKVQAVAGSDSLRGMDLGASPLIAQAMDKAVSHVWTFPEQVLVIALAPVRSAGQVVALLLVAHQLGESTLAPIERSLGVASAVLIREKIAASSSRAPAITSAAQAGLTLEEGKSVMTADGQHLVRATATSQSAGAGRVVWVIPIHQQGARVMKLQILGWMPIVLVILALALAISLFRRRANADAN
jgi:Double sensory domain of two-component sensor kinase